jgi:hypothetical protein
MWGRVKVLKPKRMTAFRESRWENLLMTAERLVKALLACDEHIRRSRTRPGETYQAYE